MCLIDYSAQDLREAVKEATEGKGVDMVYDPVGGPLTEAAIRSLAWRGRLLVIGFAQGEIPQIPANLLLIKGTVRGRRVLGRIRETRTEGECGHARRTLRLAGRRHGCGRTCRRRISLTDVPAALRSLLDRTAVGKLVVIPSK